MDLTKQEAIRLHREMWRKISEMSDEEIKKLSGSKKIAAMIKLKVMEQMGYNPDEIMYSCFLCEYNSDNKCMYCPVIWNNCRLTKCTAGEYAKFVNYISDEDYLNAKIIAKQISELPEREDI